jgi:acetyl-CoA carboxylase biotin carboxyl carrier protein
MKPEDIQDLKELIEFLKQYQVAEFDLDRGDTKIRLKFSSPASSSAAPGAAPAFLAPAVPPPPHSAPPPPPLTVEPETGVHLLKSPIVGTFYGSPSPGSSAFVASGDHVEKGQVICIVEAMKLMNEIEADAAGTVVKCLVSNGQPIEFGQPLFSIRLD